MNEQKKGKLMTAYSKETEVNFNQLVSLFEHTQTVMQSHAAKSVDIALVIRNWLFGWYIVEYESGGSKRAELYGKELIKKLSTKLTKKLGKGFSKRSLEQYRKFYQDYKEITQALTAQSINQKKIESSILMINRPENLQEVVIQLTNRFILGWTHYVTLLTVKNLEERRFYELEASENGWGYRELERQINAGLYERLALSRDKAGVKKLSTHGQVIESPSDVIKNPYILEFTGLAEHKSYSEHELETVLIDKIEQFLLELGKGFLFESRQKRFSFDNRHFYVDLVFYNRLLRCYVIIDLKVGDLKHQDLGQMQMYVNYFDRFVKLDDEKPTVGILLCLNKSDEMVQLTLPENSNIYASEYQLYLPSKEELKKQLEEVQEEWETFHEK